MDDDTDVGGRWEAVVPWQLAKVMVVEHDDPESEPQADVTAFEIDLVVPWQLVASES